MGLKTDFSSKLPKKNSFKMTNLKEESNDSNELKIQAAGGESSGSDSDKDLKTSSMSSCSSSSSGTTSKLALRMADKVSLSSSPAEKRFKFEPNEDYLDQLLAMGISSNGARKALYYTGNRSVSLATNWIFDHPELDLETPLEEELRKLEAEEDEDDALDDEDDDEDENDSDEEAYLRHHHHHLQHGRSQIPHVHHRHANHQTVHHNGHHHCDDEEDEDEEEYHKYKHYADSDEESETDSDDFDEEDIPEFKMVFVVNTSLEMGAGKVAAQVGHAALGVQRTLAAKSKEGKYKVTMTDLGLWQDFGEKMVVVKGESTQHLRDLHLMAEDLELPSFLVKDAGITQVPSGAVTVFGVFGEDDDVNKITGRLKLINDCCVQADK